MMNRAFLVVLALAGAVACSGGAGRGSLPAEMPEYFKITMVSEGYPGIARAKIVVNGDGSGSFEKIVSADGTGADASGTLDLSPEDVQEIYDVVRNVDFYGLDSEYIGDPPMGGRGIDVFTVEGGGPVKVVRCERIAVDALDQIADVLKSKVNAGGDEPAPVQGEKVVCDKRSKLIYPMGHAFIEEIPEADRVEFDNYYEALNAGYDPAPDVDFQDR